MERKTCASLLGYAVSYLEEGSVGRPFGLSVDKQVVKDELADEHVYQLSPSVHVTHAGIPLTRTLPLESAAVSCGLVTPPDSVEI